MQRFGAGYLGGYCDFHRDRFGKNHDKVVDIWCIQQLTMDHHKIQLELDMRTSH